VGDVKVKDFAGCPIWGAKAFDREVRKGFAKVAKKSKIGIGTLPILQRSC
jgi:hypothetical protein